MMVHITKITNLYVLNIPHIANTPLLVQMFLIEQLTLKKKKLLITFFYTESIFAYLEEDQEKS